MAQSQPQIVPHLSPEQQEETEFRDRLQDLLIVLKGIGPHTRTLEGLANVVELAMDNDHQLRMLMSLVENSKPKRS